MSAADDLHYWTIAQLGAAYRARVVSPSEVVAHLLARIEKLDPQLGSYVEIIAEDAVREAALRTVELASGQDRGPLHGVPIALKDIFFSDLVTTTVGMLEVPNSWNPGRNATVVDRARAAGAIIVGSVVTTEGVFSGYNPNVIPPVNPWGRDFWPGASSSGPAIAVAAGLAYGAYGSDTGGSIRFPASACAVTGLKPTWGRVSRFGAAPLAPSVDHVGPFARTARDAQLLLKAVEGYDPSDRTTSRRPRSAFSDQTGVDGLTVGVDPRYLAGLDDQVQAALDAVLDVLVSRGATLLEVDFPDFNAALEAWEVIVSTEVAMAHAETYERRKTDYGRDLAALIETGLTQTASTVSSAEMFRREYRLRMGDMFRQVDTFVCPVLEGPLPTLQEWDDAADEHAGSVTKFTSPFDLSGTPTITVPVGSDARGGPLGVQLAGGAFREGRIASVAAEIQRVTDWHMQRPTMEEES